MASKAAAVRSDKSKLRIGPLVAGAILQDSQRSFQKISELFRAWTPHAAPLCGRTPGYGDALSADVVAAEFAQGVTDEFRSDLFSPAHVEVGVVQRLGDAGSQRGSFRNRFRSEGTTAHESCGLLGNQGARSYGADYHASVFDDATLAETSGGGYG